MMKVSIAEGNCCKDSQGYTRHVKETVNLHSVISESSDEGFDNVKALRRSDFRFKKKNKSRDKHKKVFIKPHSSGNIFNQLFTKIKNLDPAMSADICENLILAILIKMRTSNVERFLIVLTKLIRTHYGLTASSILAKILALKNLIGFKSIFKWTLGDIEVYFKELLVNWKIASKNEAFSAIIALVSTVLAIVYSAEKKWTFTLGSFSLFMLDSRNACKGATGVVDALLKVVTYVMSGLKTYTATGSFSSFLYADDQLAEFDATVSKLKATMSMLQPGNLQRCADTDENAFDKDLQLAIASGEKLVALYDGNTKKYVMDKLRLLRQLHVDFIQFRAAGGLRVAPFAYLLSGSTGLGKSSLNEILMRYILAENGYNHTDAYICTLNSQDKFFSTYRSYINGVIFDDFANVRKDFVEESPCETLQKFVNNTPFYLNMAELELKGKVVAEPKVVGITTNVADLDSSIYSNQASSIMRRMKVHIYATVKNEFKKKDTIEIDPSKVHEKFGDALAPDIWEFDVFTVKVTAIPRPPKTKDNDCAGHCDDRWHLEYVKFNGTEMKKVTINELLLYVKRATNLHYKEQTQLIERSKLFNGRIVCSECRAFYEYCTCVQDEDFEGTINEIEDIVVDDVLYPQDTIFPHSSEDEIYDKIYDLRKYKLIVSLKEMLLAWVVEGKCNLNKFTESFFLNCSNELQYFAIVLRDIIQRWVSKNKEKIVEMFFPADLDDTKLGDYFTITVRKEKYSMVSSISCYYSYLAHYGIMALSMKACKRSLYLGFIIPLVGHYIINRIDIPHYVLKVLVKVEKLVRASKNSKRLKEILTYVVFPMLSIIFNKLTNPRLRMLAQFTSCSTMSAVLLFRSYDKIWRIKSPRALSVYYKKQKQGLDSNWQLVAPAVFTAASVFYKKDDILDFYTEAWETWCSEPHSRLNPSIEEIDKRDKKHRFDSEWFNTQTESFLDPLPTSKIATADEVRNAVMDNTWFAKNMKSGQESNCFVVCSGCILIPFHFIPKEISMFKFIKHNRGNSGNKQFESVIDPEQCSRVGNLDLAMMWQPKTRDVRNLIEFFPLSVHETTDKRTGSIFTRNAIGDLITDCIVDLNYTLKSTSGLGFTFPGIRYLWKNAAEGKCMSPIIADDKRACISGFHIGGSNKIVVKDYFLAYGVTPTQEILLLTKKLLEQKPTIIPMSSSGEFHREVMGVKVLQRCIKKKSCYLRMKAFNCAQFLGSSYNCNRTPRSKVRDTPIKELVKEVFNLDMDWASPMFKGLDSHSPYEPWEVGMEKWVVDRPGVPFGLLNRSKIEYTNALTRILYDNINYWKSEIRVLSWDEVVNGIPGKRFIDSMNFKSSIGFPFKGSKKLFSQNLGDTGEGWKDKRILNQEFIEEADKIIILYKKGMRYYPWFTTTLKDEPTLVGKSKVRVFQASSTPFQMVVRKYTLGICRFLQMNPLVSECAVGIDPCSSEWNELYLHLKGMQTYLYNRWFAIDYKVYDTSISSQLIICIGRIFADLARVLGYSDEDIAVLHSIFTELSFSVVDFNGDVLMLDGANPSGNPLTVFINNITNSLLMRIYFYHLYPRYTFRDHVRMMGYGDDLIASVRATVGYFNMVGYANYMKDYGFLVTPAVKDAQLTCYVGVEEVDFLKRKFVWDEDYGAVIAPLEETSIYKRLCNYMSSETDVNIIVGANIDGALDEWAFYGRTVYLENQRKLQYIVDEFKLQRFVSRLHYTYEQRIALWREHNADPAVMGKGQGMDTGEVNCDNNFLGFFGWGNIISKIGIGGPPSSHNSESLSSNDCSSINQWTNEINFNGNEEPISPLSVGEPSTYEWDVIPHSTFTVTKEEIMTLADGSSNQLVEIPSNIDSTRMVNDSSDNTLGEFLSRPIIIDSFDWSPSIDPLREVNPWQLFLENKRVVNRISNYKLLRCKMRVKIIINGNSFFYGRLMVSYWPYRNFDFLTTNSLLDIDNVQHSQMPRVFIDPTTSQGGEMSLPFFWHFDYLNITSQDDYLNMGVLSYRQLARLKHTSGDTSIDTKVTVTTYAWMEDVQLEAPTHRNPTFIVPQSTKGKDEHSTETGPITKIATSLAAMAGLGEAYPPLAPYCTPAKIGLQLAAKGAAAMGWSSPSLIEEPKIQMPRGVGNMALTNVPDSSGKLTLDAKQEITVDPRTVGLGECDELDIRYIASKETWLTRFLWAIDTPRGDLLWNCRVDPCQFNDLTADAVTTYRWTASCGATLPFEFWNGTFKLRLQFCTSAFHRGRVAVVFDPYSTALVREDNIAYTHIIDISSCRDVVFKVGPNQDRALLNHAIPGFNATQVQMWDAAPLTEASYGNGTIAIYVINELTIPNSDPTVNNDIAVNAFVSMDEDFEVFVPANHYANYVIVPQSTGVDSKDGEAGSVEVSEPEGTNIMSLDSPNSVMPYRNLVYSGEQIKSLRMLLKRYYPWAAMLFNPRISFSQSAVVTHQAFPALRGVVAGAVHDGPYNYFQLTLINYLGLAFQGWRGSLRYKWFPRSELLNENFQTAAYVSFSQETNYGYTDVLYDLTSPTTTAYSAAFQPLRGGKSRGVIAFVESVNPVLEYEIPWYTNKRFNPGKRQNFTTISVDRDYSSHGVIVYKDTISQGSMFYDIYVSAGEDFSMFYFTGWPQVSYEPNAPVPP